MLFPLLGILKTTIRGYELIEEITNKQPTMTQNRFHLLLHRILLLLHLSLPHALPLLLAHLRLGFLLRRLQFLSPFNHIVDHLRLP